MQRILLLERGSLKKLAKDVGVHTRTVQHALKFLTEGEQPDLIRNRALKFYNGVLVERPIKLTGEMRYQVKTYKKQ
jgi:hypothetical protein